jgi:hypothetical protein
VRERLSDAQLPADPEGRLEVALLEAYLSRVVVLESCASPVCRDPGERPLASPLARAQRAAGADELTTLVPGSQVLEGEMEARLVALLDGTRDRAELAAELGATAAAIEDALAALGALGLLMG